jgi:hypothetical protein
MALGGRALVDRSAAALRRPSFQFEIPAKLEPAASIEPEAEKIGILKNRVERRNAF